jgi:hypothetical protein
MTNEPFGDFPRSLFLDLAFDSDVRQNDIATVTILMTGANDGQPAEATFVISSSWQATLGFRPATPVRMLRIDSATVETPNGDLYDILPAVLESIGNIPRNFGPGDSVGDLCGGFGDPF